MKIHFKRMLFVLASLSIVMSSFVIFASESDKSGFEPAEYNEAVSMFTDLGIVDAESFVGYNASLEMTRGELAAWAVSVLGLSDEASSSATVSRFIDVGVDYQYAGEISYATSLGLFNGTGANTFSPEEPVYINQAIKVVVSMLGYREVAEHKGGYPTGYISVAMNLDLLDGVVIGNDNAALRGNIITLMYNALFADIMDISGIQGDSYSYEITEGKNLLNVYHKITEGEGVVQSDRQASITGDIEDEGYIVINGMRFYTESPRAVGTVGKNVKYYYKEISNKNIILTLREVNNDIVTLKADDEYTFDYENAQYNLLGTDREYVFKLENYDIVYNCSYISGDTPVDYEDILTPESGTVTLIDNNDNGKYEVVIVEEAKALLYGSYDAYNERIYDSIDRTYDIDLNDYSSVSIKGINGGEVDFAKLESNTVIMVYESFDSEMLKLVVCADAIEGTVSEISTDGVVINGVTYSFSPVARLSGTNDTQEYKSIISTGKNYTFYLDQFNQIVYHDAKLTLYTGYILDVKEGGSGINTHTGAHIYTADGKLTEYELADSVRVETISSRTSYSSARVKDALTEYANSNYGDGVNPSTRLFVQYGLTEGKISSIVLPHVIKTEDEYNNPPSGYSFFRLDYIISQFTKSGLHFDATETSKEYYRLGYIPSNRSIGFTMTMSESCPIFYVPEFSNTAYTESNLAIQDINKLAKDAYVFYFPDFDGSENQIEAYSTDRELRLVNNLVWIKKDGHATNLENSAEDNAVVTTVSKVVSDIGDPLVKITVLENKTKYDLYSDNLNVAMRSTFEDTPMPGSDDKGTLVMPTLHRNKNSIVPGDVIRYSKNADGYVEDIALMYDSENDIISYRDANLFTKGNAKYRHTCGDVVDIYGDYALLEAYGSDMSNKTQEAHKVSSFFRIYVYDYKAKDARVGTADDVSIGDKVYFSMWYSSSRDGEIIIYKGKGEGRR